MKILQVFRYDNRPDGFSVRCFPDSALLKGGKPVFLPFEHHDYRLSLGLGVVIGKLGKGFAPRFVDRYVDQVVPVAVFEDSTMSGELAERNVSRTMAYSFDGAVSIGSGLSAEAIAEKITFHITSLPHGGRDMAVQDFSLEKFMPDWRDAISFMAATMTFKTGDMVIMAQNYQRMITPGKHLTAYRTSASDYDETDNYNNCDTILDFNIK